MPQAAPSTNRVTLAQALDLGLEHHRAGRRHEAEDIYRRILAAFPEHADTLRLLGQVVRAAGRLTEALDLIGRAVALAPDSADLRFILANTQRDLGRHRDAVASYRAALVLRPAAPEMWCNLGLAQLDLGSTAEAETSFRRALALRPEHAAYLTNLGMALQVLHRLDEAVAVYRRSLALEPNWTSTLSNLGCALRDLGYDDEAETVLTRAVVLDPGDAGALSNLGTVLHVRERLEEALACHHRARQLAPERAKVLANLGIVLLDLGRTGEAGLQFTRCLERTGADIELTRTVGERRRYCAAPPLPTSRLDALASATGAGAGTEAGAKAGMIRLDAARVCNDDWYVIHDGRVYPDLVFHLDMDRSRAAARLLLGGGATVAADVVTVTVDEPLVLLGGCRNYYHWLFDHLPRLRLLAGRPDLDGLPLLVNAVPTVFQRDSLAACGIAPTRLRPYPDAAIIACRTLWLPHVPGRTFRANGSPDWWAPTLTPDVVRWVRGALAPAAVPRPSRRLFLSRRDAATRRCLNEDEIQEIARRHGYEVVEPGTLSLAGQIALFTEAERVAGIHGAGFANIVFAPPGCRVLEFVGAVKPPAFYETLSALCGHSYRRVTVPSAVRVQEANEPRFHHLHIDPAVAEAALAG